MLRTADHSLRFDPDRDIVVGVQVVVAHIAVRECHLELEGIGALDLLHPHELDAIALLLIVDQRAVEVRFLEDVPHLLFAQRLGILLALPRLDLPTARAVVGVDAGHPLQGELLAHSVGPLVLLNDHGFEAAAAGEPAGAAQRLHGLDAGRATDRLDVFGKDRVDSLCGQRRGDDRQSGEH